MSGPDFSAPHGWPAPPPPPAMPWPQPQPQPQYPSAAVPHGYPGGYGSTLPPDPPRPAALPVTMCMTVTAGLLWVCALGAAWLVALLGEQSLGGSSADLDSRAVLLLNHFTARLSDGLAAPLFGFPLVAVVLAFLLGIRRAWPRAGYTIWGVLTVAWLTWWLRDNVLVALAPVLFVVVAVFLVWLPSVTGWLAARDRAHR